MCMLALLAEMGWPEAFLKTVYEISSNPALLGLIVVLIGLIGLAGVKLVSGKLEIKFQTASGIATSVFIAVIVAGLLVIIFQNSRGK